jgi:hypothetical protein
MSPEGYRFFIYASDRQLKVPSAPVKYRLVAGEESPIPHSTIESLIEFSNHSLHGIMFDCVRDLCYIPRSSRAHVTYRESTWEEGKDSTSTFIPSLVPLPVVTYDFVTKSPNACLAIGDLTVVFHNRLLSVLGDSLIALEGETKRLASVVTEAADHVSDRYQAAVARVEKPGTKKELEAILNLAPEIIDMVSQVSTLTRRLEAIKAGY